MKLYLSVFLLLSSHLISCANIRNTTTESDSKTEIEESDGPIRISLPTHTPKSWSKIEVETEKPTIKTTTIKSAPTTKKSPAVSSTKTTKNSSEKPSPSTIKSVNVVSPKTTVKQTTPLLLTTTKISKKQEKNTTPKITKSSRAPTSNDLVISEGKTISKGVDEFMCPKEGQAEFQLFPLRCGRSSDCKSLGKDYRCCNQYGLKVCVKGMLKPLKEQKHQPILGVLPRKCPSEPLAELWWQVQTCVTDRDCWPRVCCPDGQSKYCRTARPEFESLPFPAARQLSYPFEAISGYLQCTPPPPPVFDSHPKSCNNTLDCFPNVCCQESGKKHCRPPKRSLFALVAGMTQRFGFIRQLTGNIVIR